jgi:hypothetical protein
MLRAIQAFHTTIDGADRLVEAGELVHDNDPAVIGRESLFERIQVPEYPDPAKDSTPEVQRDPDPAPEVPEQAGPSGPEVQPDPDPEVPERTTRRRSAPKSDKV